MMLIEEAPVATAALPLAELREHLRTATGFAGTAEQDGLLEACLRAALAAVEGRTGKALLARAFRATWAAWRWADAQALPVAPVRAVLEVRLRDAAGAETAVAADRWRLEADLSRPVLRAAGAVLPAIPAGGAAVVRMEAGFGATWAEVPPDLRQAVLLLAAQYYERRLEDGAPGAMPFGVMALLERWRTVRGFGGGRP